MANERPSVPPGRRVYAIGDIHGRADLLDAMLALIADDAGDVPATLVFLGDYVDRGPDSAAVIARLLGGLPEGWEGVALMGNHERLMLDCWTGDRKAAAIWRGNGGDATLASYGIVPGDDVAAALDAHVPPAHLAFLRALPLMHRIGDYLFVHAGIRPGVALDRQDPRDLMWMREPFLSSEADHGAVVVHGHSPGVEPCVRPNRIGIDTTAFASGVLTCLALEKGRRKFLATGSRALNH